MGYLINDTDLSTLGISPVSGKSSLIAVPGIFDFPKRRGVTERSWGIEIEAFVSADDLNWEGRDITFNGLIEAGNAAQLISRINSFSGLCKNDLLTFETPYRTVSVVLEGSVDVEVLEPTVAIIKARFTEQEVQFIELTKVATGGATLTIAGYSLENDFGILVQSADGLHSTPARIDVNTTGSYTKSAYRQAKDINLKCYILQDDMAAFVANIDQFQALLSSPGLKQFVDANGIAHNVYVKDGFNVSFTKMDGEVIADFALKLRAL